MSGITVGTALAISAGVGAAGSIGGAMIGSSAANKAAKTQSNAAMYSADLQKQAADESLAFQKDEWNTQQQNLAPWLNAGKGALGTLTSLMADGKTFAPWTEQFQAPTGVTEQNDPGFQARLQMGQQALERSAAARGNVLGGGTAKALTQYGQDYASNEYGNVYNRALGEYQQRYNINQQNQANTYNRYAGLAGVGQQAATTLGQEGQAASQNVGGILMNSAQQQGNAYQNAAAARASGYAASGNLWSNAFSGVTGNISQYMMLKGLYGGGSSAGGAI